MDDRLLSRPEVAGMIGVSPHFLDELVREGKFPSPITLGRSARSDRWPRRIVQGWLAQQTNRAYRQGKGGSKKQHDNNHDDSSTQTLPAFYSIPELAKLSGKNANTAFSILVEAGLLIQGSDSYSHYRPTDAYMKLGWFWRVEKYLAREERIYYQTVVTSRGKQDVLRILKDGARQE